MFWAAVGLLSGTGPASTAAVFADMAMFTSGSGSLVVLAERPLQVIGGWGGTKQPPRKRQPRFADAAMVARGAGRIEMASAKVRRGFDQAALLADITQRTTQEFGRSQKASRRKRDDEAMALLALL